MAAYDTDYGDTTDTRNNAVLANFVVACKTFLQAMSSNKHPIVLFIDDIQWMDEGSKPLIRLLLRAQGLSEHHDDIGIPRMKMKIRFPIF